MGFKGAILKDFRHFTDLTVKNVPEGTRLIMLVGSNGSGKSSFLDALTWDASANWEIDYHDKSGTFPKWDPDGLPAHSRRRIEIDAENTTFHVRSAYRNDAIFSLGNSPLDNGQSRDTRVKRMTDNDTAIVRNYEKLASNIIGAVFGMADELTTLDQFREQFIGDIRRAFSRLFPDLQFLGLGSSSIRRYYHFPMTDSPVQRLDGLWPDLGEETFIFNREGQWMRSLEKQRISGGNRGIPFKSLSSGEKAAFDLILDLAIGAGFVRECNAGKSLARDEVTFCIDQPEMHLHARLQAELLSVLYDLVPDNCQLMLATHSIGMMRRARDIEAENPGSVAFLDFGDRDFDKPQIIEPTKPDRTFWKKAYSVALDDLAALVAPERVVICEGQPKTPNPVNNHSHDERCYERIFEIEFPETRFMSMGNDREIVGDKRGLAEALLSIVDGLEVVRLIDRDDRTEGKIAELRKDGVRVLSRRNLESYLFDDEILKALASSVGKADKTEELLTEKGRIRSARTNDAQDDLKPASGEIYIACKKILGLTQCGNTTEEFMQETLAPLIKPGMSVYDELKRDIFGTEVDS